MKRGQRRLLVAVAALALLVLWTVVIEPRRVARRDIRHAVKNWRGPAGLKVTVAADWHFTRCWWRVMTVERAREIVNRINALQPDVILLPGDFISDRNWPGAAEEEIARVLGGLKARLGVYAVLGNHDWWHDGAKFSQALRK